MPADRPAHLPSQAAKRRLPLAAWSVTLALACVASVATGATNEHRISTSSGVEAPGRPKSPPIILALADAEIRLIWTDATAKGAVPLKVYRLTATRRVFIANGEANVSQQELAWTWTPPLTRSIVRYQIVLENQPDHPVILEVRDPEWSRAVIAKLAGMKWQATGLNPAEIGALAGIGIPITSQPLAVDQGAARVTARSHDAAGPIRTITWDEEHPDLVVWRPGSAAGDVEIRAPRWWISPAALATDHGQLRFLDLFSEPPLAP